MSFHFKFVKYEKEQKIITLKGVSLELQFERNSYFSQLSSLEALMYAHFCACFSLRWVGDWLVSLNAILNFSYWKDVLYESANQSFNDTQK